jgi:hypothetical protein
MKTWRNATMRWVVRDYAAGTKGLDAALGKGWEPFAVTVTRRGQTRVWVRRSKWGA